MRIIVNAKEGLKDIVLRSIRRTDGRYKKLPIFGRDETFQQIGNDVKLRIERRGNLNS